MEAVRRVSTIFTIDDSDHNRKLKGINDQYKLTQSEIKLAGQRMDAFGKSTGDLTFKQSALTKQIETLNSKTKLYEDSIVKVTKRAEENNKKLTEMKQKKDNLTESYKQAIKVHGESSAQAKRLGDELDKTNKDILEQERVVKKNTDAVNNYQTQVNKTEGELVAVQAELEKVNRELDLSRDKWLNNGKALQDAGDKMQKVGGKMQSVGRNLSTYVTLPLVAMGTAAINEAIKFESAFAGVQKTVDGTTEQMANLRQGIIDMSLEIPSTTKEISAVAEAAGQLGIETDSVLAFTKVIIDLGNSTNLTGEEGASSLAKFANITQMSQKDFEKLGSTIVALGNNMATTEADIVAMAMRLAGAGSQVGMTEAEILSLSAALSSVGIEAEAGGSAFSKVLVNMQLAAEKGGKPLKEFAKVAGMSSQDFAKAYKEDATGALLSFIKGLSTSEERGISAIKVLDDMGITEVRMRDSLLRAASASGIFSDAIGLGTKAWDENIALTKEAGQRYATTESQMKVTKNEIADLGREIGEQLMPIVKDGMIIIKDMVDAFKNLPPETQKNIVKFGLLAAALGPVLSIGGKILSGAGGIMKFAGGLAIKLAGTGGLTAATSGLATAAGTAGGTAGLGALTGGLGGVMAVAAPYVVAVAVIGAAGYALYDGLKKDVIPEVDLFADHAQYTAVEVEDAYGNVKTVIQDTTVVISDETEKQVGELITLAEDAQLTTHNMYLGIGGETQEGMTNVLTTVQTMADLIVAESEIQKNETIAEYTDLFNNTTVLTDKEMSDILASVTEGHEDRVTKTKELKEDLVTIYDEIRRSGVEMTKKQKEDIDAILEELKILSIKTMSENEAEQNVILNRLANSTERITAEMVGDTIKELNVQKDETIRIAGETRDETVRQAEELRTLEGGKYSAKADEIIQEANRQYVGVVDAAEKTKKEGLNKLKGAYGDLTDSIDTNTGEILTFWDKLKSWWNSWQPKSKNATVTTNQVTVYSNRTATSNSSAYGATRTGYALGTTHAIGGLTKVQEKGYEMIDLPVGSKVRNHVSSKQMIEDITSKTVAQMSKFMQGIKISDNNFIINNELDIEMVAEELAFQVQRKLGGAGNAYSPV